MACHLVVGAGGIGRATAAALVARGHTVDLASRRGTDLGMPSVRAVTLDATDPEALVRAAAGAASIVNATNPRSYAHWDRDWPPVADALLAAAERSGAGLVTVSNLYGYGQVDAPMTEATALRPNGTKGRVRASMWEQAYAAHLAGRARVTELRAADYLGPGASAGMSYLGHYVVRPAALGTGIRLPMGDPDAPHSWTYLADIGTLAATLATDERSWGRVWHVPTNPARSMREVAADAAALAGRESPRIGRLPAALMWFARVSPTIRSLEETRHQFEGPFVLDSDHTQATFGLTPTDWTDALTATVAAYLPGQPLTGRTEPARS